MVLFNTPEFYIQKIYDTVNSCYSNDMQGVGTHVFGFFSGQEYSGGRVDVSPHHAQIIFQEPIISYFLAESEVFVKWVAVIYSYFRSLGAMPEVARDTWSSATAIIRLARIKNEPTVVDAMCQLVAWDYFYGQEHYPEYLDNLKGIHLKHGRSKRLRDLFLCTVSNMGQPDFLPSIKRTYKNRRHYTGANAALTLIHYYCHIKSEHGVLSELKRYLSGTQMRERVQKGNCEFLKPLLGKLYEENNYNALFSLVSSFKNLTGPGVSSVGHGYLLPNGNKLMILSSSGQVVFEETGNYERYRELINACNRGTNTYVTLLGEFDDNGVFIDTDRGGAPPVDDDLSELRGAVIAHFGLNDSLYGEFHSLTILPSHNFPLQSALFSLGNNAPLISVSHQEVLDDPDDKRFVFFLSTHTHTYTLEHEFIVAEFGKKAEIYVDPQEDFFINILASEQHDVIYISAHGEYNHWGKAIEDEIFFNEGSTVNVGKLWLCRHSKSTNRNIILNICDGAATEISCNPYSRGIAASLAAGNQTIISHMWPVNPLYAACFGMLAIYFSRRNTPINAARMIYEALDQENNSIIANAKRLAQSFDTLEKCLKDKEFYMRQFKNLGSISVYS
ncbi:MULTISPECIES: hypothetical protein [unclassified Pseudomonas]|uniref:hypothetical protein n=1 Tax=unclassified Pseudomonas TaxID=196821 RepID=UPI002449BA9D|nr:MULTISPECIES: hypothetical protein [unclassified Pseudomonas]MDH0302435.1 hypothetical protein [Pseudomonas sp. GD04091]MDH1985681.1 hypothetical protein [Pseudomonas sp. GD03689]